MTNERTPGLAGGRNTGILAGTAPLVAFCDDDDEWLPTKVEKQVEALTADPAAITAVTGIIVLYADSAVPRVPRPEDMTLRPAGAQPGDGGPPLDGDGATRRPARSHRSGRRGAARQLRRGLRLDHPLGPGRSASRSSPSRW